MEFRNVSGLPDLINSEGPKLELIENIDDDFANERLYLRGICLEGKYKIYTKTNDTLLEMFFQGRLSVKELFLLRKDEDFIMEIDGRQKLVFCDDFFENEVVSTIEYGDRYYDNLPSNVRLEDPITNVLHIVKRDYMNGIGAINNDRIRGRQWFEDENIF